MQTDVGTVPQDFQFQFFNFFMNKFPQAPEHPIRAVLNFSKICGNIHSSRCTSGNFAASMVDNGGKFAKVGMQILLNPQIFGLNSQSKIPKFLRYANPKISYPQISFD
jgi:hypothetical protein